MGEGEVTHCLLSEENGENSVNWEVQVVWETERETVRGVQCILPFMDCRRSRVMYYRWYRMPYCQWIHSCDVLSVVSCNVLSVTSCVGLSAIARHVLSVIECDVLSVISCSVLLEVLRNPIHISDLVLCIISYRMWRIIAYDTLSCHILSLILCNVSTVVCDVLSAIFVWRVSISKNSITIPIALFTTKILSQYFGEGIKSTIK